MRSRALFAVGLLAAFAPAARPQAGQRVFIAGHSFLMPVVQPLGQIAKAAQVDHKPAGVQSIGGSTVTQHWERQDETNFAKKALKAGGVDVLILSPHFLMPDPAIDKFADLLLEHNAKGRVYLQASWLPHSALVAKALGVDDSDRDRADLAALRKGAGQWAGKMRDQVTAVNERHAKAGRPVAFVVPVGDAVYRLRERVAKGQVPGIAKQSDLFGDALGHGRAPVGVLSAYCHYAAVYGRSPVGLAVPDALGKADLGANAEKVNRILQEIAWDAVTAEPLSGVKAR